MSSHSHDHGNGHNHNHSLIDELICHFPYSVFSVAFGLALLGLLQYISLVNEDPTVAARGAYILFHNFHFMHIVFAATGTLITFYRFSKNHFLGLLVGIFTPAIFCTLSDAVLPYLGGRLLGVEMDFHLCFLSELNNVLPFLFVGILNGFLMSRHHSSLQGFYSTSSHFIHILISALASTLYLISHGFLDWHHSIGAVFVFLIVAVVVPCTLSDIVVPMFFARFSKK